MAAGPGEDAATGRQTGALQGQVRTQLSAGIRGPVSKVWPRWISVGVLAEGGLRCECCMKLCPGERAEACWGTGRLPGLGLGTQMFIITLRGARCSSALREPPVCWGSGAGRQCALSPRCPHCESSCVSSVASRAGEGSRAQRPQAGRQERAVSWLS